MPSIPGDLEVIPNSEKKKRGIKTQMQRKANREVTGGELELFTVCP